MSQAKPYQLAFTLQGHSSDVRTLTAPDSRVPLLVSGSRDGSAILWGPPVSGHGAWDVKLRVEAPEKRYVGAVGMTQWQGEAYLLVGSSNGILSTYQLPSPTSPPPRDGLIEPTHTLIEHRQNVCCLDATRTGLIASGSWDTTVIIWNDFKPAVKIEGHEQAVWAVRFVGKDRLLTASADKTIILHSFDVASGSTAKLQTFTGHDGPVRGLSLRPDGKGFWSCANDSNVNIYYFDRPDPVRTLSGHTSFVYGVAALPGGGAVSSGEDGTLRVWSETELVQTIPHASNSIWSCAVVLAEDGKSTYIASSANDGHIRYFSQVPELQAPQSEKEAWDKEVSGRRLDKSQVGDVKRSDLPGMEALGREGKKDGQVIMIKNNDTVEAYQWQAASSTWQQVGQVVDAIGSGRKQLYNGVEYDYVFDVDVSEGMPALKLPYNVSENPWIAAQRFLQQYELPMSYADQVADFIQKNTAGVQLGAGDASTYVDPYTGASRYTGASSSSSAATGGGGDPLTGGSAYSTLPPPSASTSKGVLPVKTFLSFKQMNPGAAHTKIKSLNEEVKSSNAALALAEEDEKNLGEVFALLGQPSVALPNVNSPDAGERYDPVAYASLMSRWPEASRFPLIDIGRCLAAVSPAFGAHATPDTFLQACSWFSPWDATKPRETNTLLALRGIANLFCTANGRHTLSGHKSGEWLGALRQRKWEEVGPRKLPLVTIALNYSILTLSNVFPVTATGELLALISYVLESEPSDSEVLYRGGVALGNVLLSPSVKGSLAIGAVQKAKSTLSTKAAKIGEKRLTDLAQEVDGIAA